MIKVFKTIAGDEIIGTVFDVSPEKGTFRVEYPFLVNTEIDTSTRITYTDLQPYMYGVRLSSSFEFTAHTMSVTPMEPKPHMLERYRAVVEQFAAQYEQEAASERVLEPRERLGRRLKDTQ